MVATMPSAMIDNAVAFVIAGATGCLAGVSWWVGSGEGSPFIKGFPIGAGMLAVVCFLIAWRGLVVEAREQVTKWTRLLSAEKQRIAQKKSTLSSNDIGRVATMPPRPIYSCGMPRMRKAATTATKRQERHRINTYACYSYCSQNNVRFTS